MSANNMDYNYLGKTGIQVSNLCLGTMTFGESRDKMPGQSNESTAHEILNRFSECGGNFIDTADCYSAGTSEAYLGSWLTRQQRDKYVIATKVFAAEYPDRINHRGLSRRHIVEGIEESLNRLQTNYIDLYQMHCWDYAAPIRETLLTFNDLVRCGKIRFAGASNVCGWQLQKIVDLTEQLGLNPFATLQNQYSLASRYDEFESFNVCKLNGIGVLPWSPLKAGALTGKLKRDSKPVDGRIGWVAKDETRGRQSRPPWSKLQSNDTLWNTLDVLEKIANNKGKSVAQVAIRWLIQRDVVSSVIFGARNLKQLDDNIGASSGWKLTAEEMQELNEASMPDVPYPYEQIGRLNKGRVNPNMPNCFVGDVTD